MHSLKSFSMLILTLVESQHFFSNSSLSTAPAQPSAPPSQPLPLAPPKFEWKAKNSTCFRLQWKNEPGLTYSAGATPFTEEISLCNQTIYNNIDSHHGKTRIFITETTAGVLIQPNSYYNLALCASNGNITSAPYVIRQIASAFTMPKNVNVDERFVTSIRISWRSPDPGGNASLVKNYIVYYNDEHLHIDLGNNAVKIEGLSPHTNYNISVAAINKHGTKGDHSLIVHARTKKVSKCGKNHARCVFPFMYGGRSYNSCTTIYNGNQPWCSIKQVYASHRQWLNCSQCQDSQCAMSSVRCFFPFIYEGKSYNSCITLNNRNQPWCSITRDYDSQGQWKNCSQCQGYSQPNALTIDFVNASSIAISWKPPNSDIVFQLIVDYVITWTPGNHSLVVNTTNRTITNLTSNTNYNITVAALNSNKHIGDPATIVSTTTYEKPDDLEVVAKNSSTATIKWIAPALGGRAQIITHYVVTNVQANRTDIVDTTNATLIGLLPGSSYTFAVAALNENGDLGTASLILLNTNFGPPTNLVYLSSTSSSIFVQWQEPNDEQKDLKIRGYLVKYVPGNQSMTVNSSMANITGLYSSTLYNISVAALGDNESIGAFSEILVVQTKSEKIEPPEFNITVLDLTSVEITWKSANTTSSKVLIHYETMNQFSSVVCDNSVTKHVIGNLSAFLTYNITLYTIVIGKNGTERRSRGKSQNVALFVKRCCYESTVFDPNTNATVTFPKTQVGYRSSSIESCPQNTANVGVYLGTRECSVNRQWLEPVFITSCNFTIADVQSSFLSNENDTEENLDIVATQISVLTSNPSRLSEDETDKASEVLQTIVAVPTLSQNVSNLVVESVSNLLENPSQNINNTKLSKRLLSILNEISLKVEVGQNEEVHITTDKISIAVVNLNSTEKISRDVTFQEKHNPLTSLLGFSKDQFQISNASAEGEHHNRSAIRLPGKILSRSVDRRVSFFAFANSNVFQITNSSTADSSVNAISHDATVQSHVILSASINGNSQNLDQNVSITFTYNPVICSPDNATQNCGSYLCGYWDEEQGVWSRCGCTMTGITNQLVQCQCNHLTNFATLFAFGDSSSIRENQALNILTWICCSLSLFCAILTIVCVLAVRRSSTPAVTNRTAIVMVNLAVALSILDLFLLISFSAESSKFCTAVAVILHFALLSSLLWCLVEASYICLAIVKPIYYQTQLSSKKLLIKSTLIGWGIPIVFVGLSAGIRISSYRNDNENKSFTCWIVPDMVLYLVIFPCAIILTLNITIYTILVYSYFNKKQVGDSAQTRQITTKKSVFFSISLFLMFGLTWILGFLLFSSSTFNLVIAYVFTITAGLQGLFLFLLFVARNQKIRETMKQKVSEHTSTIFSTGYSVANSDSKIHSLHRKRSKEKNSN